MIILRINNSYSQITGLDSQQHKALRAILSYEIDSSAAYFSNNRFNTKKYLIDNKGSYPSGLTPLVTRWLRLNALKASIIDDRILPVGKVALKGKFAHKPYKSQQDAVHNAVIHGQGTISMATGSGKSNVIAMLIDQLKLRTLIVVPNLELKRQLTQSLLEVFGDLSHITVENIDSAALTFDQTKYDVLIIDEAHHGAAKTYQNLNKLKWNGIYYRFFLTATPFRNNKDENLLFQALAGQVIYTLGYKKAVREGYVVPVEGYYIDLPKIKTDAYSWAEVYSELVVNNASRNEIIANLVGQLSANRISTLCLVKEIKHGNKLSELSGAPFANGQDEDSRQFIRHFNSGGLMAVIGTTGVIGEGVDTKPCEYVIIAGLGKAKSAFMQQVGRGIRRFEGKESAKIILIRDPSHKFTLRHFNEQKKILLEEYGVEVVKLEL